MSQYKVTFIDYSHFGLKRNDVPDMAVIEVNTDEQITNEIFHFKKLSKEELIKQVGLFEKLSNPDNLSTPNSLWNLAACYDLGHECERNPIEAKRYYRMAMIQERVNNNSISIWSLPYLEEKYNGVYQFVLPNSAQAYIQAEALGYPLATHFLGISYLCGHDVVENDNEANRFFEKAINLGCVEAYGTLGVSYLKGYGVAPNRNKALELFKKSYEAGEQNGSFNYGSMLHTNGDVYKAFEVMSKLAKEGYKPAINILKDWAKDLGINLG